MPEDAVPTERSEFPAESIQRCPIYAEQFDSSAVRMRADSTGHWTDAAVASLIAHDRTSLVRRAGAPGKWTETSAPAAYLRQRERRPKVTPSTAACTARATYESPAALRFMKPTAPGFNDGEDGPSLITAALPAPIVR